MQSDVIEEWRLEIAGTMYFEVVFMIDERKNKEIDGRIG